MAVSQPTPFKIAVPDEQLDRLKQKLALTTWPDELYDAGWDYGAPLTHIKRLATYWQTGYDWRAEEARLNEQLPQYTVPIAVDGFGVLDIHFVHAKSSVSGAIPLFFCHGWPGSFIEVRKILPKLISGSDGPAFHVVAPSMPNYGFSEGVKKRGFSGHQYAEVCHKLMLALGYDSYVTQGGDWGSAVTRLMGSKYPDHVKASHLNMLLGTKSPKFLSNPLLATQYYAQYFLVGLDEFDKHAAQRGQQIRKEGMGYMAAQQTKPQTIGYSQADSPVGLLAWIYEKLHEWTDDYPWTDDEILTWISIYVFSRAGAHAPSRMYYEVSHATGESAITSGHIPHVKLGFSRFKQELTGAPKLWYRGNGPLVHYSEHEEGGHFAAYEKPDILVGEVKKMFGKGGGAYGVVKGKSGYAAGGGATPRL